MNADGGGVGNGKISTINNRKYMKNLVSHYEVQLDDATNTETWKTVFRSPWEHKVEDFILNVQERNPARKYRLIAILG